MVRRIISIALIMSTLLFATSFIAYAEESDSETTELVEIIETEEVDSIKPDVSSGTLKPEDILSYSCYYDVESAKINVKGTINYDAFAIYRNSELLIYEIPIGKSESDVINDENMPV